MTTSSSKRLLVVVGLVAAIAAVGLIWWLSRDDHGPRTADAPAGESRPARPVRQREQTAATPSPENADEPSRPQRLVAATAVADPDARAGAFAGRVVNWATGRGVADAEIVLSRAESAVTVRSGADGKFVFEPTEPATYRLSVVTADGFLPYAPQWGDSPIEVRARPGIRVEGVVIYLTPSLRYTGKVVATGGAPVEGASIRVIDSSGERALEPVTDRFVSDARGEFEFFAPDEAVLEATHARAGRGRATVDATVTLTHQMTIELSPDDGAAGRARIAGIAVDDRGQAIADVKVTATPAGEAPTRRMRERQPILLPGAAVAGDDGRFEITGLDPVDYALEAAHPDKATARQNTTAPATEVRIVMSAAAVVRGRVRAGGKPVAAFSVVAGIKRGLIEEPMAQAAVIDAEGEFALGGLDPGDYWVRVTAPGHALSAAVDARAAIPSAPPVEIELSAGGTAFGTVIDIKTRKPLGQAKVAIETQVGTGPSALPFETVVVTDDDGSFELSGLAAGRHSLLVSAYQHDAQLVTGVEVSEGARVGPLTVELTPVAEGEQPKTELAGLGLVLGASEEVLLVQDVVAGGGGEAAGIQAGEAIVAIDGRPIAELGFQNAMQAIRGPVGTTVRVRVRAKGGQEREVTATRVKVRV